MFFFRSELNTVSWGNSWEHDMGWLVSHHDTVHDPRLLLTTASSLGIRNLQIRTRTLWGSKPQVLQLVFGWRFFSAKKTDYNEHPLEKKLMVGA